MKDPKTDANRASENILPLKPRPGRAVSEWNRPPLSPNGPSPRIILPGTMNEQSTDEFSQNGRRPKASVPTRPQSVDRTAGRDEQASHLLKPLPSLGTRTIEHGQIADPDPESSGWPRIAHRVESLASTHR